MGGAYTTISSLSTNWWLQRTFSLTRQGGRRSVFSELSDCPNTIFILSLAEPRKVAAIGIQHIQLRACLCSTTRCRLKVRCQTETISCFQPFRTVAMQDRGYELPRIPLPRTRVNRGLLGGWLPLLLRSAQLRMGGLPLPASWTLTCSGAPENSLSTRSHPAWWCSTPVPPCQTSPAREGARSPGRAHDPSAPGLPSLPRGARHADAPRRAVRGLALLLGRSYQDGYELGRTCWAWEARRRA